MALQQRMTRLLKGECGQNLIEFALSAMLLLMLALGIADFGGAFQQYIILTNVAREGARTASRIPCVSIGTYASAFQNAALAELADTNIDPADVSVAGPTICPDPLGGTMVTITASMAYPLMFAEILGLADPALELAASVDMVFFGNDQATP